MDIASIKQAIATLDSPSNGGFFLLENVLSQTERQPVWDGKMIFLYMCGMG